MVQHSLNVPLFHKTGIRKVLKYGPLSSQCVPVPDGQEQRRPVDPGRVQGRSSDICLPAQASSWLASLTVFRREASSRLEFHFASRFGNKWSGSSPGIHQH